MDVSSSACGLRFHKETSGSLTLLIDANIKVLYYYARYKEIIKRASLVYFDYNPLNSDILSSLPFSDISL